MARGRLQILTIGVTARAMAESAQRSGFDVSAIDGYADLDLEAVVVAGHGRSVRVQPFRAPRAAAMASRLPSDAVVYGSPFENHPGELARLSAGRSLWGNPPEVIVRVRNPHHLFPALRARGFPTPEVSVTAPDGPVEPRRWLLKPMHSGGGQGIRAWRRDTPIPGGQYLQEWIDGEAGSIVFLADGQRAVPLAVTRQLVGEGELGAGVFRYCGNLLGGTEPLFEAQAEVTRDAVALAEAVTREFGLVGLNGLDFIAGGRGATLIEVNPRFSASMELVERASSLPLLRMHAEACAGALALSSLTEPKQAWGKAVVFARRHLVAAATEDLLTDKNVRDIPRGGTSFSRGQPVCTVFATAPTAVECRKALIQRAGELHRRFAMMETIIS